jgi:hypothetical protein
MERGEFLSLCRLSRVSCQAQGRFFQHPQGLVRRWLKLRVHSGSPNSALYQSISLEPLYNEMRRFCDPALLPKRWTGNSTLWKECNRMSVQLMCETALLAIRGKGRQPGTEVS